MSVSVSAGIPPEGFTAFLIGLYLNISPAHIFLECESSGKSIFFNGAKMHSFLSPVAVTSRKLSEICKRMSHDRNKVTSDVDSYQQ